MGKLGRIFCISTPMLLTIASFITQVFVEVGGWDKNSDTFTDLYFFQADFSELDTSAGSDMADNLDLAAALGLAQTSGLLAARYNIYLWNYCAANSTLANGTAGDIDYCSDRESQFYFDPVEVWGLTSAKVADEAAEAAGVDENVVEQAIGDLKDNVGDLADKVLDGSAKDALKTYKTVSKWMFIAYQASLWINLATIVAGILAIFSRWGSLLTWILSFASSFFSFAASLTASILFGILTGALKGLLDPYNVKINIGSRVLGVTWLSTAFSLGATFFWLFSVCCCSGRSNPHHKNNKGGLWAAEPKGQGYGFPGRGRSLRVEKTGGYERVGGSPYVGGQHGENVPLQQYPGPAGGHHGGYQGGGFEPYRS